MDFPEWINVCAQETFSFSELKTDFQESAIVNWNILKGNNFIFDFLKTERRSSKGRQGSFPFSFSFPESTFDQLDLYSDLLGDDPSASQPESPAGREVQNTEKSNQKTIQIKSKKVMIKRERSYAQRPGLELIIKKESMAASDDCDSQNTPSDSQEGWSHYVSIKTEAALDDPSLESDTFQCICSTESMSVSDLAVHLNLPENYAHIAYVLTTYPQLEHRLLPRSRAEASQILKQFVVHDKQIKCFLRLLYQPPDMFQTNLNLEYRAGEPVVRVRAAPQCRPQESAKRLEPLLEHPVLGIGMLRKSLNRKTLRQSLTSVGFKTKSGQANQFFLPDPIPAHATLPIRVLICASFLSQHNILSPSSTAPSSSSASDYQQPLPKRFRS